MGTPLASFENSRYTGPRAFQKTGLLGTTGDLTAASSRATTILANEHASGGDIPEVWSLVGPDNPFRSGRVSHNGKSFFANILDDYRNLISTKATTDYTRQDLQENRPPGWVG